MGASVLLAGVWTWLTESPNNHTLGCQVMGTGAVSQGCRHLEWPAEHLVSLGCPISLRCLFRDMPHQPSHLATFDPLWPQLCLGHAGLCSCYPYSHLLFFNFSEDLEWGILLFPSRIPPLLHEVTYQMLAKPDRASLFAPVCLWLAHPSVNIAAIQSSPIGIAYSPGVLRLPLANAPSTLGSPVCISSEGLEFDSILKYLSAVWASVACMSHRHFKLKLHQLHMTGHPVTARGK